MALASKYSYPRLDTYTAERGSQLLSRVAAVSRNLFSKKTLLQVGNTIKQDRNWIAASALIGIGVKAAVAASMVGTGGAAIATVAAGVGVSNIVRYAKERTRELKVEPLNRTFARAAVQEAVELTKHLVSKKFWGRNLLGGAFGGVGYALTHGVSELVSTSAHAANASVDSFNPALQIEKDLLPGGALSDLPSCDSPQVGCGSISEQINTVQAKVLVEGDIAADHLTGAHNIAREAQEIGKAHPELAERAAAVVAHAKALAKEAGLAVNDADDMSGSLNKMAEGGSLTVQKPVGAVVKMSEGLKAPETAVRGASVRSSVRPVHHVAAKVSPVVPAVPEVDFTPVIRQKLVEMAGRLGQDIPVDASNADIAKMISADHPDAILNMMKSQAMQEHAAKVVEVPKVAKAAVPSSASAPKVAAPVEQPVADKAAIPETTFKASEPVPTKYPDALKRALEQVHGKPLTDCETHITVDGQGKPTVNPVCQGGTPDAVINPGEHVRIDGQNIQLAETSRPTKLFNWLAERKIFTMMGCKKILGMSDISAEAGMMCAGLVPQ